MLTFTSIAFCTETLFTTKMIHQKLLKIVHDILKIPNNKSNVFAAYSFFKKKIAFIHLMI